MPAPSPADHISGALSIVTGAVLVGAGAGVVPVEPGAVHVPAWALGVCGALAALGGVALVAQRWPAVRTAAVATMFVAFGGIGGYVALHAEARHLAGGIGVFPDWINLALARGTFGFGALLCFGLFAWTVGGLLRPDDAPDADGRA